MELKYKREVKIILEAIRHNHFILKDHAQSRSTERTISRQHVINIANTLIEWKWQQELQTYWFIGFLDPNKSGGFTAVIDNGVWVETVFKRKLTKREKELIK